MNLDLKNKQDLKIQVSIYRNRGICMAAFSKKELRRARLVKEEELYQKEGYKKAVILGRSFNDYENHLYAFLIDLNICLVPVYVWGVEFILILCGIISPSYFDLLFYLMYGLLFVTSCIMLPLYTASTGGYSWGGRLMGLRLVRPDKQPASAIRLVLRQLFGFGIPMMLFGYFFSVFGIVGWWLVDGLVTLVSPDERTIADWIFGTVLVYAPRYAMKVVKEKAPEPEPEPEIQPEPVRQPEPAPQPAPVRPADFDSNAVQSPVHHADNLVSGMKADIDDEQEKTKAKKRREEARKARAQQAKAEKARKQAKAEQTAGQPKESALAHHEGTGSAASAAFAASAMANAVPKEQSGKIDLHIRSNFSDDSDAEVEEIFRDAAAKGLEVISITDHNNARANALAAHFAGLYSIRYIPGVEIDCQLYGERVRILGYYINWNDPFFDGVERLSLRREKDVSLARIEAFEKATGLKVNAEALLANSRFKIMRPKELTNLVFDSKEARNVPLIKNYLATSKDEKQARERFVKDYFGPGAPCEIKAEYPGAIKVIDAIHEAGGMAILSGWHLDRISNDVIEGLLDGGIDGFEVFSPNNSDKVKAFLLTLASDEKLFVTAGSDYHGAQKKDRHLGVTSATPKGEQIVSIFTRPISEQTSPLSHDE